MNQAGVPAFLDTGERPQNAVVRIAVKGQQRLITRVKAAQIGALGLNRGFEPRVGLFGRDRASGELSAQRVGHGAQRVLQFAEPPEAAAEMEHAHQRHGEIGGQHRQQQKRGGPADGEGDKADQPQNEWVRRADDEHTGQPPDQGKFQADIPAEIQRHI